jgi:chromosome partitioning protein
MGGGLVIITVTNQKGGVGKTTIALNLALAFHAEGARALLVDADPQGSAMTFREVRGENKDLSNFSTIANTSKTIDRDILPIAENFDYVVIDSGGRDSKVFRASIMCAAVVLVPIVPGTLELWGSDKTFDILDEASVFNKNLKVLAMLNQVIQGTKIEKEILLVENELEKNHNLKFLKKSLCDRVAFRYSIAQGKAIFEMNGEDRDVKAIEEFDKFFKEFKEATK